MDAERHSSVARDMAAIEASYRPLIEQLRLVIYVVLAGEDRLPVYVSPGIERLLGFPVARWLAGREFWESRLHPEDWDRVLRETRRIARAGGPWRMKYRLLAADDREVWVRDEAVLVPDGDGRPHFWHGVLLDISEAKATEQALRDSEAKYRALVESVPAIVYLEAPDEDRRTLFVSPQVEEILGYTQQEWLEQPDIWMELLHPDDREPTLAAHDRHSETGEPWSMEYRLIASDGREVWFHDEATLVTDGRGRPLFWQGVRLDITRRKLAEEALLVAHAELEQRVRERTVELKEANELMMLEVLERRKAEAEVRRTEERYRVLLEQIPAMAYIWEFRPDPAAEAEVSFMSPQVQRMLGFSMEEWRSRPDFWVTRLHPDDREVVLAAVRRSGSTGEDFSMEFRILAKDGRVVWVRDEARVLRRDEGQRPWLFHGLVIDITKQRETEERLRQAEARYRTLVEQIPAAVYIHELEEPWAILYISPQVENMLGYPPDRWYSDPKFWRRTLHPDDTKRVLQKNHTALRAGRPFRDEYRGITPEGQVVWLRDEAVVVRDSEGIPLYWQGMLLDVTEQRRAAELLNDLEAEFPSPAPAAPDP